MDDFVEIFNKTVILVSTREDLGYFSVHLADKGCIFLMKILGRVMDSLYWIKHAMDDQNFSPVWLPFDLAKIIVNHCLSIPHG